MKLDNETLAIKEEDMEFQTSVFKGVKDCDDVWELTTSIGSILSPKIEGFTPEIGQTCKFYGKGLGYAVRGIEIDGVVHSYLTIEQQDQKHKEWCENRTKEQKESYEKNKESYLKSYEQLPPLLKTRMDALYKKNPDDRFDWEGYEMFIMKQATVLFNTLHNPETIEEFFEAPWAKQKEMCPELDDGHSNNTFNAACFFARCLAEQKDNQSIFSENND